MLQKNPLELLFSLFLRCKKQEIYYIGGSEALPLPLSKEEECALTQKLYTSKDKEVRSMLIERNLRLVVFVVKRFENTLITLEDLISIGTIGLVKAVNTFDPRKKIKLATYASRCIENEVLMYLRHTKRLKSEVSLDEPLKTDFEGNELLLSDVLGTENDLVYKHIEEHAEKQMLLSALDKLPQREKKIIIMRFGLQSGVEMTQKEVADALNISQSYISRLEKKILSRLSVDLKNIYN